MGRGSASSLTSPVLGRHNPDGSLDYFHQGVHIQILPDPDPMDPRDADNPSTFYCWHPDYQLGDKQFSQGDYESMEAVFEELRDQEQALAITPLFLYDHSGLSISSGQTWHPGDHAPGLSAQGHNPFDAQGWDTTMIGFAYNTKAQLEAFGNDSESEDLTKHLEAEIDSYNDYLSGNCWGFIVAGETDDEDSCWGFLGDIEYCKSEAEAIAGGIAVASE